MLTPSANSDVACEFDVRFVTTRTPS